MTDVNMSTPLCVRTHDDDEPRLATHGRYCTRCWARLNVPLSTAGELAQHLVGMVQPSSSPADDRVDGSREAPLPLNQAAFDDASELYAMLVYWCSVFSDQLRARQPDQAIGAWRNGRGTIIGLPVDTTPERAGELVTHLAQWIRDRLDAILSTAPVDDVDGFTEQIRDVWRMNARWPRVEKPSYSKMPCPRQDCGARMAVYPPTFVGDDRRVICTNGHWFPDEEYSHLLLVFQQIRKEKAQAERVAQHLIKKYNVAGWSNAG